MARKKGWSKRARKHTDRIGRGKRGRKKSRRKGRKI